MSELHLEILRIFDQRDAEGEFIYSIDDLRAVMPVIFLSTARAVPDLALPPRAMESIASLVAAAGIDADDPPAEAAAKLEVYAEKRTKSAQRLLSEIQGAFSNAASAGQLDTARSLGALIGVEAKLEALESDHRPDGTVRAGPAARFLVGDKLPPKE
jgi:hypothetical protein